MTLESKNVSTSQSCKKFSRRHRKIISTSNDAPRSRLSNGRRYRTFGCKTLKCEPQKKKLLFFTDFHAFCTLHVYPTCGDFAYRLRLKWKCLTSRLRKKFSRRRRKLISMSKDAPRSLLSNAHRYTSFGGKTLKLNRKNFAPPPHCAAFWKHILYMWLIHIRPIWGETRAPSMCT